MNYHFEDDSDYGIYDVYKRCHRHGTIIGNEFFDGVCGACEGEMDEAMGEPIVTFSAMPVSDEPGTCEALLKVEGYAGQFPEYSVPKCTFVATESALAIAGGRFEYGTRPEDDICF